ncbi:hypothetical protein SASPL_129327 [Salvia splendens]|uniref:THO complex subunit 6 n=1 Tax=Salvia splendens TaxID=180675 RepID=A0A8X8XET4_SALSN|nr:hypothetical protein SASPL_129327 [Salvia splendens]
MNNNVIQLIELREQIEERNFINTRSTFKLLLAPATPKYACQIHRRCVAPSKQSGNSSTSNACSQCCQAFRESHGLIREDEATVGNRNGYVVAQSLMLYFSKLYHCREKPCLGPCGDDGRIRGWKWKEILESKESEQGDKMKPVLDLVNPQHKGPWGALSPIPENNAIAVDSQSGSIYAAAGDSCAYCWDMEKSQVKMAFKGHSNYLHCIVSCNSSSQIITGSEDGTARIWDCKSGKCIQVINPEKVGSGGSFPCVSCIALDSSESWLVCGKGQSLSVWNLPARECVSVARTQASVQDVLFDENQIVAVGSEPLLTRLNMNGDIISQIECAPTSAFSVSLHPSGVAAVSGYGAVVDMISQFGSHLCTFRCRGV